MTALQLPARSGPKPTTHGPNPHEQADQNAPPEMQAMLLYRAGKLPDVVWARAEASGSRGLLLASGLEGGPRAAFLVDREFVHFRPPFDGSLHLTLPQPERGQALEAGWVEPHPLAGQFGLPDTVVMLYGPRNAQELEIAWSLLLVSHAFARG